MNIHLDSIHLPSFFSGTQNNILGELHGHFVRNMQILSNYMRYNELTLAGSIFGINLGLIALSEKTIDFASPFFESEFFQRAWVRHSSSLTFKSVFVGTFLYGINRFMNLQLNNTLLAISVITSIAFKTLWQHVISPEINCLWKENEKIEEPKTGPVKEKEIVKDDDIQLLEEEEVTDVKESVEADKIAAVEKKGEEDLIEVEEENEVPDSAGEDDLVILESETEEPLDDLEDEPPSPIIEHKKEDKRLGATPVPSDGADSMMQSAVFFGQLDDLKRFGVKTR